jgi:glycosyltransferase involved in cell wall biosynthesis
MSDKPTLCIDARMINNSGIGTYIKNLIIYIVEKFEVTLLGDINELNEFKVKNIIPLRSKIYSIKEQFELFYIVPKCDIFWSPHYNVPLFGVKAAKRVVSIHDAFYFAFYNNLNLKQKFYAKYVMNKAVKESDVVITVSDFSKSEIVKYTGIKPGKIQVIHNGVKQAQSLKDIKVVRTKYKLPLHYILFVGNVKPHKNLKNFLKAYLMLNLELSTKFKIVIVGRKDGFIIGDNELFNLIDATAALNNNITFTGFVDEEDMDTIYSNASLFVFPSIYEGFGLPTLEAMLNNCPVLASNINSLSEVCGDAAVYFDPFDATDINKKMVEALTIQSLTDELKIKGKERIKLFDWANSAEKHVQLFNQIIN